MHLIHDRFNPQSRNTPEYQYDRTADLIGLTVYAEYLYYPGYYVVPWNYGLPHYTGTINDLIVEQLQDPYQKAGITCELLY